MPSLIRELAVAGSHKSDGSANASGKVFLYEPNTTTIVAGYKDDTLNEAWTTVGGGIPLDAGGRVKIWINDMIDVVVTDSDGGTIDTMLGYNKTRAEQVEIENEGFTGNITDATGAVTQGLGGITDLDTVLTSAFESLGPDFQYQESPGADPRPYIDVITEIAISVKSFGAVGNGVHDDTTAIQEAIDRVKALGGGVVYFPPGTYKISGALALASGTGVRFAGAGMAATIITSSHGSANVFTLTSCASVSFEGMDIRNSSTSTGSAFSLTSTTNVRFIDVGVDGISGTGAYRFGVSATSSGPITFQVCRMTVVTGDAAARCVVLTASSGTMFLGGFYNGRSGFNWELAGATSSLTAIGVIHNGSSVRFAAGMTLASGSRYAFVGGTGLFFSVGTATLPYIMQLNCSDALSGSGTTSATGAAQTPVLYNGREVLLAATSGGAGTVTVNAPAILPGTQSDDTDLYWDFVFTNAAGGAVTWSLNAVYVVTAAIPTTAAHTISVRFRWDRTTSKLREVSRADTVT